MKELTVADVVPVLKGGGKIVLTTFYKGNVEYNRLVEENFGDCVVSQISFNYDEKTWEIKLQEEPVIKK